MVYEHRQGLCNSTKATEFERSAHVDIQMTLLITKHRLIAMPALSACVNLDSSHDLIQSSFVKLVVITLCSLSRHSSCCHWLLVCWLPNMCMQATALLEC